MGRPQGCHPASSPWTDDKVEELRRLWAAGYSASEIAHELGIATRNAVIGKATRLGLAQRKSTEFKPGPPPEKRGPILRRAVFIAPKKEKPVLDVPTVSPPEPGKPRMRRLQLLQLAEHHCHWPIGTPGTHPFYFCAADKDRGEPYCQHHMVKAFVKPRGR